MKRNLETMGMLYGLLGAIAFSLSLPATKIAVTYLPSSLVSLGRAVAAAIIAAVVLWIKKEKWPTWEQWRGLAFVAMGVIVGFPFLSSWAMERVPSSHGAVIIALLPLASAGMATWLAGEKPSRQFWLASFSGCLVVIGFAVYNGLGKLQWADIALLGAVVCAALGYAEGGKLARAIGGWQVICWALLLTLPVLIWPVAWQLSWQMFSVPASVWISLLYLVVINQLLAFVLWYRGLALGGVAKVSQIQYLQPFFTFVASAWLLGERITISSIIAAVLIIFIVAQGRKAPVLRAEHGQQKTDTDALPRG